MKVVSYLRDVWSSTSLRKKIIFTILTLILYRFLVFIPVPFVDIVQLNHMQSGLQGGLQYFAMLLGGTLKKFSIIAVGLIPYINASIIMQLLTAVLPQLEELQEQGEVGNMKIQQYTRWMSLPLAFVQSIGMIYFIANILGKDVFALTNFNIVLLSAFVLTVGTVMLMYIGELITEKGITNGISLIIFASIVSGISSQIYGIVGGTQNVIGVVVFMVTIVLVLVLLSVLLIRTRKEIPIVYARQGKVEETAVLPIPLNPVGMIPIIFAIAFTTFPYLLSQIVTKFGTQNQSILNAAKRVETNLNIYTQNPSLLAIFIYFIFIILFTFFYTLIVFYPEKIADNIQRRGGFIPGIRPGEETAKYINRILLHLCFWGGMGLGFIGIYSYILSYIPFIETAAMELGSIPVIVSGAGVIIIVGVVQEMVNKINAELLMEKYDKI